MTDASRAPSEGLRKAVHVGCGAFAVLLAWLPWPGALAMALGALAFAVFVSPRLMGDRVHRGHERARGWSPGIVLYAVSVVILVLVFRDHLEFVAAGWGLMAFGDGTGTIVGLRFGRHPLPWNPRKSWEGLAAHVAFGAIGASALAVFVAACRAPDPLDCVLQLAPSGSVVLPMIVACCAAAVVTALVESIDSGVDDNLTVPLLGGGLTWVAFTVVAWREVVRWDEVLPRGAWALGGCVLLGLAAVLRRSLTIAGAMAAVVVGTIVAACGGWLAFALLCAFFVAGTLATRLGRGVKEARGIAQERGGRRGVGNVVANGGLAALCALLMLVDFSSFGGWDFGALGSVRYLAGVALVAAIATATFDTLSSEVGKAFGGKTYLVTTLRPVPAGTEGAVSVTGTLAGLGGACVIAQLAQYPFGTSSWESPPMLPVVLGAFVGTTFESVVGALHESRGHRIDNDLLNFANTVVGALAAVVLVEVL